MNFETPPTLPPVPKPKKHRILNIAGFVIFVVLSGWAISYYWHPKLVDKEFIAAPIPQFFLTGKIKNLKSDSFILEIDKTKIYADFSTADRTIFFDKETIVRDLVEIGPVSTTTPPKVAVKKITAKELKEGDSVSVYSDEEVNQAENVKAKIIERLKS